MKSTTRTSIRFTLLTMALATIPGVAIGEYLGKIQLPPSAISDFWFWMMVMLWLCLVGIVFFPKEES